MSYRFYLVRLKIGITALKGRNMSTMGDSPSRDIAGWQSDITPFQGYEIHYLYTQGFALCRCITPFQG